MKCRIMGATEWALLVVLSLLWGGSFFFVAVALEHLGPLSVVLGRVGIAAVVLTAWVHVRGGRMPREPGVWGAFLVMGALNNVLPFTLIAWGQTHIDSGLAAILNATTPLFTVVLAHLLTTDEPMTTNRVAGVTLGFVGVAVLVGPGLVHSLDLRELGGLAVLGAACSYGLAGIYGRRFKGLPPAVAAAGMLTAATAVMVPLAALFGEPFAAWPGASTIGAVLGLALLGTALGYLIYFRILATAGATNLLLVTFLIPISAILLGATLLGERLAPEHFAGMALIGLGLAAIDGRPLTWLRRRHAEGFTAVRAGSGRVRVGRSHGKCRRPSREIR